MTYRHLREPFRHARRGRLRQRLGRMPVLSAAMFGAAAMAALPASQAISATPLLRPDQAAVVDLTAQAPATLGAAVSGTPANAHQAARPEKAEEAKEAARPEKAKEAERPEKAEKAKEAKAPARLELYYQYGVQTTGWYCGPAAARMAVSARGIYPSQDELASRLGTTVNGTNSSADITRVLNAVTRTEHYHTTSIPTKQVNKQQIERLRADVVHSISQGFPVVMNVAGTGTDINGNTYSYPGGHYITVVGYQHNGTRVKIGDSANPNTASYWISTANLTQWAGTRGYAA
jgi:hypothetical protein